MIYLFVEPVLLSCDRVNRPRQQPLLHESSTPDSNLNSPPVQMLNHHPLVDWNSVCNRKRVEGGGGGGGGGVRTLM